MDMSKDEYKKYVEKKAKKSKTFLNCFKAFFIGGIICTIGEFLSVFYQNLGIGKTESGGYVSLTLVFLSALLTSVGVYDKIAKHAGAGTLVPITGFANAVVSPAIEFKDEGLIFGLAANIFKIAGPVITYGIISSVIVGMIYLFV